MKSKMIIKQSTISALILGVFFLIAILLGASIIYMSSSIQAEQTAEKRRAEFKQLSVDLGNASDYLTEEARKFAVTKDITHLNNYWREIKVTRTRDKVIARLGQLNSPPAERELLAEAKKHSDDLVGTETHSMRLVLEGLGLPESEMVPEVTAYPLNIVEERLSKEEKFTKARDIMFDAQYDVDKASIMNPIAKFQEVMNTRLEAEFTAASAGTRRAAILQAILAVIIIGAVALLIRILFSQVNNPIRAYTELLRDISFSNENFRLVPAGSYELRLLAKRFNTLYNTFQEELVKRKQAEETMKKAKDEAEHANNAKSEFLANMSHEIRTPLNTITGYTYLLENSELLPKQTEYADKIDMAAKNLLSIINEILDFSKIEARRMTLELVDFDLFNILDDLCGMFGFEAQRKEIKLNLHIKSEVPRYLKGDPVRLKQVLLNLLANSVKFTHEGNINIAVELMAENSGRINLCFHVADTGIGISEEQKKLLFEAFTQGDASTSRKYGGTGLGLAICKKMVELMGGHIGVESEPGKGAEFSFTANFNMAESIPVAPRVGQITRLARIYEEKKILLVEDNVINLQMTKEILDQLGFTTDTAENGFIALHKLGKKAYDVVIIDIRMPEMDGYETTRRIRRLPGTERLPVIALSADAVEGVAERAKAAGMNGYLTKPLSPGKLIEVLKSYIPVRAVSKGSGELLHKSPEEVKNGVLDWQMAVVRIGGDKRRYREIIRQFTGNHVDDVNKLIRFLSSNDYTGAKILIHTIKGIAQNIGALSLSEASIVLEKMILDCNQEQLTPALAEFQEKLDAVCVYAATQLDDQLDIEEADNQANPEDIYKVLIKLLDLLRNGDVEAKNLFQACRQKFRPVLDEEQFVALDKNISSYNFYEAIEVIQDLILRMNQKDTWDQVREK